MRTLLTALTILAASAGASAAQDAAWTVGGQIGVVSDYRDRGYTLSNGEAAVQGDVSATHRSGFYVGAWASTIDDYGIRTARTSTTSSSPSRSGAASAT